MIKKTEPSTVTVNKCVHASIHVVLKSKQIYIIQLIKATKATLLANPLIIWCPNINSKW